MSQDQPKKKVSLETPTVEPTAPETKGKYTVPPKEEGLFHVEYEPRSGRFDAETGKKRHKPFVQKFSPRDFALQISTNDAGEPVLSTVGWRINKFLHIPAEKFLSGVIVRVTRDKKDVNIPIAEALDVIHGIIKAQDAEDKK